MRIAFTGALGYSGKDIARRLIDAGHDLLTLTFLRPAESVWRGGEIGRRSTSLSRASWNCR
jgi:nucleoside-diphosphate-sugar epimerase